MFVVLSPTRLCADVSFDSINGLLCTTVRPVGRPAKAHEVFLDPSDGLDWITSVRCNVIFRFAKAAASAVTPPSPPPSTNSGTPTISKRSSRPSTASAPSDRRQTNVI
ncbi:MAG: hypothetical protein RL077_2198 [Verrucomicrobiota bacterium]|jgi:hypothetical protein